MIDTPLHGAARALALVGAVCGLSLATPSLANVVTYSLTGAVFNNFFDEGYGESVSGTWTVDFTHNQVKALSLEATGGQTLEFDVTGVGGLTYTGGDGVDQYEMFVQSTVGSPFYLDWQATAPVAMLTDSVNGYQSNLYRSGFFSYSGLTDPGVLTATAGATVPEPAEWVLMLGGFGLLGVAMRRGGRGRSRAAVPLTA